MRGLDAGLSYAQIGRLIDRDRSVVWREVAKNINTDGDYHALMAHSRGTEKLKRPKAFDSTIPSCAPTSKPGWTKGGVPN